MANHFYDLPTEIIDKIENNVLDEYRKEHAKLMEDTFDTIHTARYNVEFEFEGFMEEFDGLEGEFEECVAIHGWNKSMAMWLADYILSDTAGSQTSGSWLLEQMANKINIKYEDQISKPHDGTEFILFIKDNIKHYDDEKNAY